MRREDIITTEYVTNYCSFSDMTYIMKIEYIGNFMATQECVGWYHGEPNDIDTKTFNGKLKAEYYSLTSNIDLYLALINVLDAMCKDNNMNELCQLSVVVDIATLANVTVRDFVYVNELPASCKGWSDVIREWKRLWKEGKRS